MGQHLLENGIRIVVHLLNGDGGADGEGVSMFCHAGIVAYPASIAQRKWLNGRIKAHGTIGMHRTRQNEFHGC